MTIPIKTEQQIKAEKTGKCAVTRREFLLYSGAAATAMTVPIALFPGSSHALQQTARVVGYPRKFIANLADLARQQTVWVQLP